MQIHLIPAVLLLASTTPRIQERQDPDPTSAPRQPWLVTHQEPDGHWDADGFDRHDPVAVARRPHGAAEYDVAVTSLAVLALLGEGNSLVAGPHREHVQAAVRWLAGRLDESTGWIGDGRHGCFLRHHALATLALCEARYLSSDEGLAGVCERAVRALEATRQDDGGWSASGRSDEAPDARTTGWVFLALTSAREGGTKVPQGSTDAALGWFDGASFASDADLEACATGLLCSLVARRDRGETKLERAAERLVTARGAWEAGGLANLDLELYYLTSLALYQMGGRHWRDWSRGMKKTVLRRVGEGVDPPRPSQQDGVGGGAVADAALWALSLETYFRYARMIGAR